MKRSHVARRMLTREAVAGYIRENLDQIKIDVIDQAVSHLSVLEADEIIEKFLRGGKEYGIFDIESICSQSEFADEIKDIVGYVAIQHLQSHE